MNEEAAVNDISTTEAKSTIALGLAEIVERLTAEEKREFTQLVNWEELQRLRSEVRIAPTARRVGDPRLYLQTTQDGLSLDLPLEHVPAFIAMLQEKLASQTIEIYVRNGEEPEEVSCLASNLVVWLESHADVLREGAIMMEFGRHTLISAGEGCLSLTLEDAPAALRREIAQQALTICGFPHQFRGDRFSALVWRDQLEVTE
jgi:hypothetical protein